MESSMMTRREFVAGLVLPFAMRSAAAQQSGRVYGVVVPLAVGNLTQQEAAKDRFYGLIIEELRKAGFVLGNNLRFEFFTVDGHFDRMGEVAKTIVRSNPDVIFSISNEFSHAIKDATSSIPVVAFMNEAVLEGFAKSLARPGGNFTGMTWTSDYQYPGKALEVAKEAFNASRVGALQTENRRGTVGHEYLRHNAGKAGLTLVDAWLRS